MKNKQPEKGDIILSLDEQEMFTKQCHIVRGFLDLITAANDAGSIQVLAGDPFNFLVMDMEDKIESISDFIDKKYQEAIS